jgi:hypothetical protein
MIKEPKRTQEDSETAFEDDDDIYCFGYNDIKLLQGKQIPFILR